MSDMARWYWFLSPAVIAEYNRIGQRDHANLATEELMKNTGRSIIRRSWFCYIVFVLALGSLLAAQAHDTTSVSLELKSIYRQDQDDRRASQASPSKWFRHCSIVAYVYS
jgi:hypothetical protein